MEEHYIARRRASAQVDAFSHAVLGGRDFGIHDFEVRDGYHQIRFDRDAAARRFTDQAPAFLDGMLASGPALAEELAAAIVRQDGPYIAAVGELSWLVAQGSYCYGAFQISRRRKQYTLAQPVFTLYENVDRLPLALSRLRLLQSFEAGADLDLAAAETLVLAPGERLFVNGFEEMISFGESGVALAMVSTLPLGAFEATFWAETGRFIGLFSTEMRISSVDVTLRTLGAAGWPGAMDIAGEASRHATRELRWAALNYMWRCDPPDLAERLSGFIDDADPQIAAIAGVCLREAHGARTGT